MQKDPFFFSMARKPWYEYCPRYVAADHDDMPTEESSPLRGHWGTSDISWVPISRFFYNDGAAFHKSLSGSLSR